LQRETGKHEENPAVKIRQLIHLLEAQDPEADVAILLYHDGDTTEVFDVKEVSDGNSDVYIEVYQETW
jgi:hypothetical protein